MKKLKGCKKLCHSKNYFTMTKYCKIYFYIVYCLFLHLKNGIINRGFFPSNFLQCTVVVHDILNSVQCAKQTIYCYSVPVRQQSMHDILYSVQCAAIFTVYSSVVVHDILNSVQCGQLFYSVIIIIIIIMFIQTIQCSLTNIVSYTKKKKGIGTL